MIVCEAIKHGSSLKHIKTEDILRFNMPVKERALRYEDIPVMNCGKYVLEKIKAYKNQEAVVSHMIINYPL